MAAFTPADFSRRSFVYRSLVAAGARFAEQHGAAVADDFGGGADAEARQAQSLGLADLSPLPRIGFKGRGTLDWLAGHGVSGFSENNMAYPQPGASLVARLAPSEVLVLGGIAGNAVLCDNAPPLPKGASCGHRPSIRWASPRRLI